MELARSTRCDLSGSSCCTTPSPAISEELLASLILDAQLAVVDPSGSAASNNKMEAPIFPPSALAQPVITEDNLASLLPSVPLEQPFDITWDNKQPQQHPFIQIQPEDLPGFLDFMRASETHHYDQWAVVGQAHAPSLPPVTPSAPPLDEDMMRRSIVEGMAEEARAALFYVDEDRKTSLIPPTQPLYPALDQLLQQPQQQEQEPQQQMNTSRCCCSKNQTAVEEDSTPTEWDDDPDLADWVMITREERNEERAIVACSPTPSSSSAATTTTAAAVDKSLMLCSPAAITKVRPGFFEDWPSFGVLSKLQVVGASTVGAFVYGFVTGAQIAIESFLRLLVERPVLAGGMGLAAALTTSLQPSMALLAVEYVVLGGVVLGTSMAAPVLIVGTTGVFISAALYHSYELTKRSVVRALT